MLVLSFTAPNPAFVLSYQKVFYATKGLPILFTRARASLSDSDASASQTVKITLKGKSAPGPLQYFPLVD